MHIAVPGGTGMLGSPLVEELVRRGHEVRVLTRTRPSDPWPCFSHRTVDLTTGAGLHDALDGVDVVIDAANTAGGGRKAAPVLVDGTRRLVEAGAVAGVWHHVAISIVGIDRVPFSYYRAKLAQEQIVREGPVAWSIVRATQFHELLDLVFTTTARAGMLPAMGFPLAPVDPRHVAHVLADAAEAGPGGRLAPVAGPRTQSLRDLAGTWRAERGRRAVLVALPLKRVVRRALAAGALTPADAIAGGTDFGAWLRERPAAAAVATAPAARAA